MARLVIVIWTLFDKRILSSQVGFFDTQISYTLRLAIILMALFASSCENISGPTGPQVGYLKIQNDTSVNILIVQFTKTDSETWGRDRLGSDEVIRPGRSKTFELSPGRWDVRLTLSDLDQVEKRDFQIRAGQTTSYRVWEG